MGRGCGLFRFEPSQAGQVQALFVPLCGTSFASPWCAVFRARPLVARAVHGGSVVSFDMSLKIKAKNIADDFLRKLLLRFGARRQRCMTRDCSCLVRRIGIEIVFGAYSTGETIRWKT
jgi:hypothetical protein